MTIWNTELSKAPRGHYRITAISNGKGSTRKVPEPVTIVAASACGMVCLTRWLDDEKRWNMFTAEVPPIAWQPYPGPRAYVDDKGRTRYALDLPAHPTLPESWFATFMRERSGSGTASDRQREYIAWRAARSQQVAA